jgi:hypothetical protein
MFTGSVGNNIKCSDQYYLMQHWDILQEVPIMINPKLFVWIFFFLAPSIDYRKPNTVVPINTVQTKGFSINNFSVRLLPLTCFS